VAISASFGSDIWEAQNFGQIMYAIRTRSGNVYLKIKRNFGDMSALEVRARRRGLSGGGGAVPAAASCSGRSGRGAVRTALHALSDCSVSPPAMNRHSHLRNLDTPMPSPQSSKPQLNPTTTPTRQDEDVDAAEKKWKSERRGGNYGAGTKEMQARNYVARKEQVRKRRELFDDALVKYRGGDLEVGGWAAGWVAGWVADVMGGFGQSRGDGFLKDACGWIGPYQAAGACSTSNLQQIKRSSRRPFTDLTRTPRQRTHPNATHLRVRWSTLRTWPPWSPATTWATTARA